LRRFCKLPISRAVKILPSGQCVSTIGKALTSDVEGIEDRLMAIHQRTLV
jgi:hypothetical protein